jgi:hypothetical protein
MSATGRGGERLEADNYPTPSWCVRRLLEAVELPAMRELPDDCCESASWIEPCAGDGAIIRAVQDFYGLCGPCFDTCEVRRETADALTTLGVREVLWGDWRDSEETGWEVAISNPPYSIAEPIIRRSLEAADWVVMLLRSNFLGSEERAAWLRECPPDVYQLPNRPSFAQSVKCVASIFTYGADGEPTSKTIGCGWQVTLPLTAWRPESCPLCGGKVRVTTTDATEYAWFVWPPERKRDHGIVKVLAPTPLEERKAA